VNREDFTFGTVGLSHIHDSFSDGDEATVLKVNVILINFISQNSDTLLVTELDDLLESVFSKYRACRVSWVNHNHSSHGSTVISGCPDNLPKLRSVKRPSFLFR